MGYGYGVLWWPIFTRFDIDIKHINDLVLRWFKHFIYIYGIMQYWFHDHSSMAKSKRKKKKEEVTHKKEVYVLSLLPQIWLEKHKLKATPTQAQIHQLHCGLSKHQESGSIQEKGKRAKNLANLVYTLNIIIIKKKKRKKKPN